MVETRILALAVSGSLLLACFSPRIPQGLACGPGGECPPGDHCEPTLSICVPTELAPVAGLRFVSAPSSVEALTSTPAVRLELVDAGGQVVALDGGSFTLALDAGHTGVQMSGGQATAAVAGVVTFPGLVFDRPGRGLSLGAHSATGLDATSATFEVTATPPVVSALAPPTSVESCAALPYTLAQAQALPVDLLVEVDPDGPDGPLPFRRATQAASAPGLAGVQGVRATAAGTSRQFTWNSSADLPGIDASAELRLSPRTGAVAGAPIRATVKVTNGLRYQATIDQDAAPTSGLFDVEVTDMDADGWPDVVTGGVAAVQIHSRHGATVQVGVGDGATVTLATGDFNGDGLPDVAIGRDTGLFLILQQRSPRRSFAAPVPVGFSSSIRKLVAADFDHDGLADLAAVLGTSGDVVVLHQQRTPAGSFVEVARPWTGGGTSKLLLADLDHDGTPDLVIGRDTPTAPVAIVRADRHGFLAPATDGGLLGDVLAVGDLDHDGKDDVAAVHTDGLHVLTGAGAQASLPGLHADAIVLADLDGDGLTDLITARAGTVAVRAHGADRRSLELLAERKIGDAAGVLAIVAADVDRDGRVDVLTAANLGGGACLVTTFQSTTARACGGRLGGPRATSRISATSELRLADFDADGKVDLLNNYGSSLQLTLGLGDGTFSSAVTQLAVPETTISGWIFDLVVGDLDGDRLPDLAWVADQNDVVQLLYDDPAAPGTFVSMGLPTLVFPIALTSADIDGDGILDLVVMGSSQLTVWHGDPAGTRGAYTADTLPFTVDANQELCANAICDLTTGDVNGDGVVDLVVMARDTLEVLLGDRGAPHGFDAPIIVELPFMRFLGVGNVIGDAADEILLDGGADAAHSRLTAWSVDAGHTTLEPVWELLLGEEIYDRAALADLDGDGHPELALECVSPAYSTNLLSPQLIATESPIPHDQVASFGGPLAFADVDGDGVPELVVASGYWGAYVADVGPDGHADFDVALDHAGLPVTDLAGRSAFGDFNGDGLVDVATIAASQARLVAQSSAHPGTLETAETPLPASGFVALADLDGDRRADLITNGALTSLAELSRADGTFEPICPGGSATWPAATGDVDGDGYADLVFVAEHDVELIASPALACAAPRHLFDFRSPFSSDFRPVGVALADVNADGRLDVVTLSEPVRVALQSATARGSFDAPTAYPSLLSSANYCTDGVVVDIDRDGALDVVTGDGTAVAILHGDPDAPGSFGAVEKFFMVADADNNIGSFSTILTGDVDGDGWPDLVLANVAQSFVLRQDPGQTVRFPDAYAVQGHGIYSFGPTQRDSAFGALIDFDADGKLDYVFTDPSLGTRLLRGR